MTRTDTHRPSAIIPTDYAYIGIACLAGSDSACGAWMFLKEERERINAHMQNSGGDYSRHAHGGNCHICGNVNAIFTAVFHHHPSNTYVRVGRECAEKLGGGCAEIDHFKRQYDDARQAQAGKKKAQALLNDRGHADAWAIFANGVSVNDAGVHDNNEVIAHDMVRKLITYGDLSEKQWAFLAIVMKRIADRPLREAARKAEQEAAAPIPEFNGRARIAGVIVGTKFVETQYGSALKIIVKHADGWKVYGTCPAALSGENLVGSKVAFSAMIQRSNDDPKFGFFTRPTKPELTKVQA